jgi:Membrane carboxypeptidase (penicillin-binding protein)
LGIDTWTDKSRYGLSLTLGGGEVTMIDMAEAFGVLANLGYKVPLTYYLKIEDSDGEILKEYHSFRVKEIDPGVAFIISDILSDNQARVWAFGPNSALEIPGYKVAVKTGTTDSKKDNWTIGYTPDFLVAVWVGNNDGSPMNPYLSSGITGAAPIWNRMMTYLLKNYGSNNWYQKPNNVVEKICYFGRKEYFLKGTENKVNCQASLMTPTPTP